MNESRSHRIYHILLNGNPDDSWADWFANATFDRAEDGTTMLTVNIPDQPALMGLLIRLNNLGLEFVSITCNPC
jgi:hypothetical protein